MTEAKSDLGSLGSPVQFERTRTLDGPEALAAIQSKLHPKDGGSVGASESKGETKTPTPSGEQFGGARKGAKQWQEDSFCHFISATGRVYIGGVFDGHGGYNGAYSLLAAFSCICAWRIALARMLRLTKHFAGGCSC